jgi:phenylacetic acid degradation operon negative regulatory protein
VPSPRARTASTPTVAQRRAWARDLVDTGRPLTARSVLASALLGAREPRLPVGDLIVAASLFGISPGATRTCLWRMVSNGELTTDNATYALAGHLLERRRRVDEAARADHTPTSRWSGSWELAVVSRDRRAANERVELRKAASALHLAEIREGVWARPDNLDPGRVPTAQTVLDQQCVRFRAAASDISADAARSLFGVEQWARDAGRLIAAMEEETDGDPGEGDELRATLTLQFSLSIAVVRHLQHDPLLPSALLPDSWPAPALRSTYRRFDRAFQRRLGQAMRRSTD